MKQAAMKKCGGQEAPELHVFQRIRRIYHEALDNVGNGLGQDRMEICRRGNIDYYAQGGHGFGNNGARLNL